MIDDRSARELGRGVVRMVLSLLARSATPPPAPTTDTENRIREHVRAKVTAPKKRKRMSKVARARISKGRKAYFARLRKTHGEET